MVTVIVHLKFLIFMDKKNSQGNAVLPFQRNLEKKESVCVNKKMMILDFKLLSKVQECIVLIRDVYVISDADVGSLYGVETKRINEAVRNNPDKFPKDYMFMLTKEEVEFLRTKFSTTKISSKSRSCPKVFTEKGLYMLATILKSKSALEVTFAIIETFTKVRYLKRELVKLHNEKESGNSNSMIKRFGDTLSELVMPELETSETESTLELNFFIGKLKHTVKKIKKH